MALRHLLNLFSAETFVVAMGLVFGIFVARGFGVEAKGLLAAIAALVGLGSVLSSLGVSYSAVKLGGGNTNRIFITFSLFGSLISLLFIVIYELYRPTQRDIFNHILELYIVLFFTIYNLQGLAFILSRPSRKYYPLAIITGQLFALFALLLMYLNQQFDAIWVLLATAGGQFLVSFYYLKRIHVPESKASIVSMIQYIKASLNQAPISYITAISIHIPVLVISSVSLSEAGIYSVAAASVMLMGKIPRLLHGMTIGGVMFNSSSARSDFFKLQGVMIIMIVSFHLVVPFLIQSLYGEQFFPAVLVSIILVYSMVPLLFIALGEARLIVFEKYNTLIAYKFIACSLFVTAIYMLPFFGFDISSSSIAWCIFGYRYLSALLLLFTARYQSVKVFG